MSYISSLTMKKMKSAGFSFPEYEDNLQRGNIYWTQERTYVVGGLSGIPFSDEDIKIFQEGTWLPSENHLLEWLQLLDFTVSVSWDASARYYYTEAIDTVTQVQYKATGPVLAHALAKLVTKICKSNLRSYIPPRRPQLDVQYED